MISPREFGELRLHRFLPALELAALENWEFMEEIWVGEALGFSEWLCLASEPEILRSLAIDFGDFPAEVALEVLERLDLPVRPGMSADQLQALFGEPSKTHRFVSDREALEFEIDGGNFLSCTVEAFGGLSYAVLMAPGSSGDAGRCA